MSLIACPECTREISDRAPSCPHCGVPNPSLIGPERGPAPAPQSEPSPAPEEEGAKVVTSLAVVGFLVLLGLAWGTGMFDGEGSAAIVPTNEAAARVERFQAGRDSILQVADSLLGAGRYRAAQEVVGQYVQLGDARVKAIYDSAQVAILLVALPSVPASDAERNANLYGQLVTLRPQNEEFRRRAESYGLRAGEGRRRDHARVVEQNLLDQRMDATATVSGQNATTLRIQYVLFNRVWANEFSKNVEMFTTLRSLGFRRLELTDGYDFEWAWTLNP